MKTKNLLTIILMAIFVSCSTVKENSPSEEIVAKVPEKVEEKEPVKENLPEVKKKLDREEILKIVGASSCGKYYFKPNRGYAPKGFLNGMGLAFAQAHCFGDEIKAGKSDALANYGLKGDLVEVYTLLIGMAMIESSGIYCTGVDTSSKRPDKISSSTAETGLFQTSFNSTDSDKGLYKFWNEYKRECFLEEFSKGIKCSAANWKNQGTGAEGLRFQKEFKECPALAVDYAGRHIRIQKNHYYPFVGSKTIAEFRGECKDMLLKIERLLLGNPNICGN